MCVCDHGSNCIDCLEGEFRHMCCIGQNRLRAPAIEAVTKLDTNGLHQRRRDYWKSSQQNNPWLNCMTHKFTTLVRNKVWVHGTWITHTNVGNPPSTSNFLEAPLSKQLCIGRVLTSISQGRRRAAKIYLGLKVIWKSSVTDSPTPKQNSHHSWEIKVPTLPTLGSKSLTTFSALQIVAATPK